jgi:DNA helicase II / ATP-dependent DNA helicase PcrA
MSREYVLQPFRAPVELQIDYAAELNEQQHAAVTAPPGPVLVIAGAGSGKTRTLTYRVAYLLEQGIPEDRILLLTFTNKAAREMMRRVVDLLGQQLPGLWGGTFHAIGNRILRLHADRLGFGRDFTILDREDALHLIKACRSAADSGKKESRFPKAEVLADIFSLAVNTGRTVKQIMIEEFDHYGAIAEEIVAMEKNYQERKRAANAMDFDDLLALWLKLMTGDAEIRERYQRRFQFILVDEYQDTNKLQSDLIDALGERSRNVMVVGDDAQSIYAWRGANFQNILKFPQRYPGTKIYKIETNYRSTPEILEVANAAIRSNQEQFSKVLTPARKSGMKPAVVACYDGYEQAAFVVQRAMQLREEGIGLDKMIVLYRSHFHAMELQLELVKRHIRFSITSGVRFFEQAHVKDVTAYLKLALNPRDELPFKRIVEMFPGIGPKAAEKLWQGFGTQLTDTPAGRAGDMPSAESRLPEAKEPVTVPRQSPIATALQACAKLVPAKAAVAWAQFTATISQLENSDRKPSEMIKLVIEAGYEEYLEEAFMNHRSRLEDLQQLGVFALQFPSVEDFLSQMALLSNVDAEEDRPAKDDDDEQLRLSTIHQAKGLEFDVVFVIMLCEGLFPSERSMQDEETIEEERRLMYVAITRAKNELYLSFPLRRTVQGMGESTQFPSRFLKEIPNDLIEEWNLRGF